MKKSLFEQLGGTYHQHGDYLLPDLSAPGSVPVGIWGQRRLRYIRQRCKAFYTSMLLSGKLNGYLSEIDRQAEQMFSQLVKELAEREGVTEQLKEEQQMEWVGRMNNIRNRAVEFVMAELIYS